MFKRFFSAISDLIFIPKCAACFCALPSGDAALCEDCMARYEAERDMRCPQCLYPHRYCKCNLKYGETEIPLIHVTGYDVSRDSVSKRMVLHIKDNALKNAFSLMADDMADVFLFRRDIEISEETDAGSMTVFDCDPDNTCITWISRSKKARRRAGHDQSEELAKRISSRLGFPYFRGFTNTGRSAQKTLDRLKRAENAEASHMLSVDPSVFSGKAVLIIDDIVTSGASIGVCANILYKAGASKVVALTFARTVSSRRTYRDTLPDGRVSGQIQ